MLSRRRSRHDNACAPSTSCPSAPRSAVAVRIANLPTAAVLRTRTTSETRRFLKGLVAADSDRILGFTMFGAEAGEVMAVVQAAMLAGLP